MSLIILLHSSKTMRVDTSTNPKQQPVLLTRATELVGYIQRLTTSELAKSMHISAALAQKTKTIMQHWATTPTVQTVALDSFVGDIYSGLQVPTFTAADRTYANQHLRILSGLYGIIRPLDGICPYRLEMGYVLPNTPLKDLYEFWGDRIAATLPKEGYIVNTSSVEFSKTITAFVDQKRLITPQFLTIDPKTKQPTFKVVHAKIARGAFAHWLIVNRITNPHDFTKFDEIGYRFDAALSQPQEPAFVCHEFGGKGLSMRLR